MYDESLPELQVSSQIISIIDFLCRVGSTLLLHHNNSAYFDDELFSYVEPTFDKNSIIYIIFSHSMIASF